MRFTAYGAARNVTGTRHLLEVGPSRVLLDCGLFQGHRAESERRNRAFPFDPSSIHAVLLTHAHLDHSGNLPSLVRAGFRGPVLATAATADLAAILLRDSARLQEHDAEYLNARRGSAPVRPLYTEADVEAALPLLTPVHYDRPVAAAQGVTVVFRDAGHILGSAMLEIDAREKGRRSLVVFTGDLGRAAMPILRDPYRPAEADVLVTESTYGGRLHAPVGQAIDRLARLVTRVAARGGKVIVPAFAVGRTQALLADLHALAGEGRVPRLPVFVDSPLAVGATDLFEGHPECFDEEMLALVRRHDDPLGLGRVTYVRTAAESKALLRRRGPMVVVSASGMCEGGRVLHHLRQTVGNRRNAVLLVGFQAEGTLGARLAAGEGRVRILGESHAVRAEVAVFGEFSAHADAEGLETFATGFRRPPGLTAVVHGNEENALALARRLSSRGLTRVVVPFDGEAMDV